MSKENVNKSFSAIIDNSQEVSFEDLKQQITKDFQLAGISFYPDECSDFNSLIEWLSQACKYLIERDFQTYLNLLYRIDVPAERFMALNQANTDVDSNQIAALLVFEREVQKIKLRKKYS